jgi:hypothetical protein
MSAKNRNWSLPATAFSVVLLTSALSAQDQSDLSRSAQWRIAGHTLNNSWSQPAEHSVSCSGGLFGYLTAVSTDLTEGNSQ